MRALTRLCAVLLLMGCASGGNVAPPANPDAVPDVEPAEPAALRDLEAECSRAARLAETGEHKPAVEALEALLKAGATCPDTVMETVEDSRRRLTDADELARRGLEARRLGDIAAARESFLLALTVYPRYYWVQKLVEDLPADASHEIAALRKAAAERVSSGRPEEALEILEQAALLPSAGPEVAAEIGRLRGELAVTRLDEARRAQQAKDLSRAFERAQEAISARPDQPILGQVVDFARRLGLDLFSTGELVQARDLWEAALSLDQGNGLLQEYLGQVNARLRNLAVIKEDGS